MDHSENYKHAEMQGTKKRIESKIFVCYAMYFICIFFFFFWDRVSLLLPILESNGKI